MGYSYAKTKIAVAVTDLATGTGKIKDRIIDAHKGFHTLKGEDFPEELKDDWNKIYEALTKEAPTYNEKNEVVASKVENSLKKMSINDAVSLAEQICDLNTKLQYDSNLDLEI